MKNNFLLLVFGSSLFFWIASAFATESMPLNPQWGKIVASCKFVKNNELPHVYLFKQWHLSPEINTHDSKPKKPYAQEKNQTAIYAQLRNWIEQKKIKTIVAEGCEGELDQTSTLQFNHWGMKDLEAAAKKNEKTFSEILTSVPFKLEAKYGATIHTVCGDETKLTKENLIAFSDARADLGYLSRLIQYKNDPIKLKIYLDGVIEAFKLPANSSAGDALTALSGDFKASVARIKTAIDERSNHVVEVLSAIKDQNIAIVFGGMHAKQILKKLEEKGYNCDVVEPVGYQSDEESVLAQLESAVAGLDAVVAPAGNATPTSSPK